MGAENTTDEQPPRERGTRIHRREARRQIYVPYGLGVLLVIGMFLIVALPSNPVWRIRAQAIADWTYSVLCLVPLVLCLLPLFLLVAVSVYGMNRLHSNTERPLRKLENLAAGLAKRIENASHYVNRKTIDISTGIEPAMQFFSAFDAPEAPEATEEATEEEKSVDDRTEQQST